MKLSASESGSAIAKDGTGKSNASFACELLSRQSTKETEAICENDIKKAEAAAGEAIGSAVKVSVERSDGQKPLVSRSTPSTAVTPSTSQSVVDRGGGSGSGHKVPRRKPGARECMQISRRFGANIIPQNYMETLLVSNLHLYRFNHLEMLLIIVIPFFLTGLLY